jgi:hypothetical protein
LDCLLFRALGYLTRKLHKTSCNTSLIARNLPYNSLSTNRWMCYTLQYFARCPSTSTALRQRGTSSSIPFLYQFEFRSRSHFFTSSITSSSFPNLFPQTASLKAATRWQSEKVRFGLYWGGGENSPSKFYDWVLCFQKRVQLCVVVPKEAF